MHVSQPKQIHTYMHPCQSSATAYSESATATLQPMINTIPTTGFVDNHPYCLAAIASSVVCHTFTTTWLRQLDGAHHFWPIGRAEMTFTYPATGLHPDASNPAAASSFSHSVLVLSFPPQLVIISRSSASACGPQQQPVINSQQLTQSEVTQQPLHSHPCKWTNWQSCQSTN